MVYNGDAEAFKWWHLVGGWNIKFPYYDWYENDQKLYKHIKIENRLIFDFMKKNKLSFSMKDFKQLVESLSLEDDLDFYDTMFEEDAEYFIGRKGFKKYGIGTTIAVYNPDAQTNSNLDDLIPSINTKIADKHNEWRIDEVLIDLYGKDWLDKIHAIIEGEKINENYVSLHESLITLFLFNKQTQRFYFSVQLTSPPFIDKDGPPPNLFA